MRPVEDVTRRLAERWAGEGIPLRFEMNPGGHFNDPTGRMAKGIAEGATEDAKAYVKTREQYGYIVRLGSHVFFHGLSIGETNRVEIADGKTLVIKYLGPGDLDKEGMRTVSFELNGIRRDVKVPDPEAQKYIVKVPMADPEDKSQVGASIPGAVSSINVKVGDEIEEGQTVIIIEAMKMETATAARMSGIVEEILVEEGQTVKGGQLLIKIKQKE